MNKESYSYYKQAYRANKRYKVKIGSDDYGPMLSKKEYEASQSYVAFFAGGIYAR